MAIERRRSSVSSTHPRSPPRSPRAAPRPAPPLNPPEPPITLLHPARSRTLDEIERDEREQEELARLRAKGGRSPIFEDSRGGGADRQDGASERGLVSDTHAGGKKQAWYVRAVKGIGSGMWSDIAARAPYYVSDWTDAWNYRVVPATWFIFFANVFPGIAFSLDLIETTGQYGVQEVLLASFMAAFVFGVFGGQPLLISGVTGPITVFNKVIFDIFESRQDAPVYLHFIGWVYLWGAIFHFIAALTNACKGLKWVTRFSCDTFGFYVAAVYVQYGIQVIERQFKQSSRAGGFLGIILALIMLVLPHYFNSLASSGYINKHFRRFCADYGMPITVIATTGLAYWGYFNPYVLWMAWTFPPRLTYGRIVREEGMTLPTTVANFQAVNNRPWLVQFWLLEAKWVGIALPFGLILFILFYFDSNVSSLIAQGSEFPLKKPPGFHWDFFLLGITTFIAGLLGLPAPNGLIPQAPLHTSSLVIMGYEDDDADSSKDEKTPAAGPQSRTKAKTSSEEDDPHGARGDRQAIQLSDMERGSPADTLGRSISNRAGGDAPSKLRRRFSRASAEEREHAQREQAEKRKKQQEDDDNRREVPVAVVEQRVSNLAQGALCLVLMTEPFERVLGLIPKGVMAGLFWYMGTDALLTSGVTEKMLYLVRDRRAISPSNPLNHVRKSRIIIFLLVELIGFGATFAITQTIAAIGFPVIIMLLIPARIWIVPRLGFTKEELDILDGPVASPFTLESVGGSM